MVTDVTGSIDTIVDGIGVWSGCSILNSIAGEACGCNVILGEEAGFKNVDTETETMVGAVAVRYATSGDGVEGVETIIDVVCREDEARTLHDLVGSVRYSKGIDSVVAMTTDCVGSSEAGSSDVGSTLVTVIAMVRMGWTLEVSSDVQIQEMFRG